jgi:H+-translocating NAD(P) transhydrogenase subunit alpha
VRTGASATVARGMKVGIPKERTPGERRVALVPESIGRLGSGAEVVVETGAGDAAGFSDEVYRAAGAAVGDPWEADVVAKVAAPTEAEAAGLRSGQVLVAFLAPLSDPDGIDRLAAAGVLAFALESIPRITRAQPMDALSSQATVSGYKGALLAADRLPRFLPMLMTAAGTIPPAKVLVLGAGVAGLQAIATARRLGAVVTAFDVRPVVREQVESLGATFLDLEVQGEETEGGYARELSAEQQDAQRVALQDRIPLFDAVITTAAIPGRPAPKLISAEAVRAMKPGSVIVDLAAETGGNCELTTPGEERVEHGVTIVGLTNVPSTMPTHASQLLSRNVVSLLALFVHDGELVLDWEDEIVSATCVTRPKEVAA